MDTRICTSNENLHKTLRNPANIYINLTSPETRVHVEHFCCTAGLSTADWKPDKAGWRQVVCDLCSMRSNTAQVNKSTSLHDITLNVTSSISMIMAKFVITDVQTNQHKNLLFLQAGLHHVLLYNLYTVTRTL